LKEDFNHIVNEEVKASYPLKLICGLRVGLDGGPLALGGWRRANHRSPKTEIFPCPAIDEVFVTSSAAISKMWIVRGICAKDSIFENFEAIIDTISYNEGEIEEVSLREVEDLPSLQTFKVNISDLENGLYRVFWILDDDEIEWQNLYKGNDLDLQVIVDDLDSLCR